MAGTFPSFDVVSLKFDFDANGEQWSGEAYWEVPETQEGWASLSVHITDAVFESLMTITELPFPWRVSQNGGIITVKGRLAERMRRYLDRANADPEKRVTWTPRFGKPSNIN